MLKAFHALSANQASMGRGYRPDIQEDRTETEVNFEKLDRVFNRTKSWFCETQQAQVWDILKFMICKKSAARDAELIEKFYDLKAIAGDGHKSKFTVTHGCNGNLYEIDLRPDCCESLTFKTSPPSKPLPDNPYRKYLWAAGASVAAMAAYAYLRPDFRAKVVNNLCQEAYGLVTCSYDANQGWREFALNLRLNEKLAECQQVVASRLTDAAEFFRAGACLIADTNRIVDFAATIPAATLKHAYAIACWKFQLYVTKQTWDSVSGWLFQSSTRSPSSLGCIVDAAGIYFSSVPYLQLKGIWAQAAEQASQTNALLPPAELETEVTSGKLSWGEAPVPMNNEVRP